MDANPSTPRVALGCVAAWIAFGFAGAMFTYVIDLAGKRPLLFEVPDAEVMRGSRFPLTNYLTTASGLRNLAWRTTVVSCLLLAAPFVCFAAVVGTGAIVDKALRSGWPRR